MTDKEIKETADAAYPPGYTASGNNFRNEGFVQGVKTGNMLALNKIRESLTFLADKDPDPLVKIAYGMSLTICELHLK